MPKSQSKLEIDDHIKYLDPETNKVVEVVLSGFRRDKQGGMLYLVTFVGHDLEVELSPDEMRKIWERRILVKDVEEGL